MGKFVSVAADESLPSAFGIEVKEVEFREFDRRSQTVQEGVKRRLERRGFMTEVDHLIRDLNAQTNREYATKVRKR